MNKNRKIKSTTNQIVVLSQKKIFIFLSHFVDLNPYIY